MNKLLLLVLLSCVSSALVAYSPLKPAGLIVDFTNAECSCGAHLLNDECKCVRNVPPIS